MVDTGAEQSILGLGSEGERADVTGVGFGFLE
jgi:hypothetical protein